jgi:tetratricopeptide (TPR) repeat protein
MAVAERALVIAAQASLPRPARALGFRGWSRCMLGDAGGIDDLREALALASATGMVREETSLYNNLAIELRNFKGPRAALDTFTSGLAIAESRGVLYAELNIRGSMLPALLGAGELDELLASARALEERAEAAGDELDLIEIRSVMAIALTYRGEAGDAERFLDRLVAAVRRTGRHDLIAASFGAVAVVRAALGAAREAVAMLAEVETSPALAETTELSPTLPAIIRAAVTVGRRDIAQRVVARLAPVSPYSQHALAAVRAALAEANGDLGAAAEAYADAAGRWEGFGVIPEEGFARLGRGRCLLATGHAAEAAEDLLRARDLFAGCGMRPALEEAQALVTMVTPLSS